jgi:hypothetical protein
MFVAGGYVQGLCLFTGPWVPGLWLGVHASCVASSSADPPQAICHLEKLGFPSHFSTYLVLGVNMLKNLLPNPRLFRFSAILSSTSSLVLHFTFRSVIHLITLCEWQKDIFHLHYGLTLKSKRCSLLEEAGHWGCALEGCVLSPAL